MMVPKGVASGIWPGLGLGIPRISKNFQGNVVLDWISIGKCSWVGVLSQQKLLSNKDSFIGDADIESFCD